MKQISESDVSGKALIGKDILLLDIDSHDVATLTLNRPHLRKASDDVLIQRG